MIQDWTIFHELTCLELSCKEKRSEDSLDHTVFQIEGRTLLNAVNPTSKFENHLTNWRCIITALVKTGQVVNLIVSQVAWTTEDGSIMINLTFVYTFDRWFQQNLDWNLPSLPTRKWFQGWSPWTAQKSSRAPPSGDVPWAGPSGCWLRYPGNQHNKSLLGGAP